MADILPTIIYPSTVTDYNARLKAAVDGTNLSVQNCQGLDAATRTSWGLFYSAVTSFVQEDLSFWTLGSWWGLGSRMDRAESYSQELLSWQNQIAKSCKLALPNFDPTPPGSGDLVKVVQYLAWGAGAVAVAYTVGQFISVIPKHNAVANPSITAVQLRALAYQYDPEKYARFGHRKMSIMRELENLGFIVRRVDDPHLWDDWAITSSGIEALKIEGMA